MNLRIAEVWELLDNFKDKCQLRGWKTSEYEDWVKTGNDRYNNFIWIQTVHQSTFEKICANHKVAIFKGVSYQVVDVSYIAWLFLQNPPENLMQRVKENREYSRRVAIYDLSWVYAGKPLCLKLNETVSMVFKEFERFLEEEFGVEVKPVQKMPVLKIQPRA